MLVIFWCNLCWLKITLSASSHEFPPILIWGPGTQRSSLFEFPIVIQFTPFLGKTALSLLFYSFVAASELLHNYANSLNLVKVTLYLIFYWHQLMINLWKHIQNKQGDYWMVGQMCFLLKQYLILQTLRYVLACNVVLFLKIIAVILNLYWNSFLDEQFSGRKGETRYQLFRIFLFQALTSRKRLLCCACLFISVVNSIFAICYLVFVSW